MLGARLNRGRRWAGLVQFGVVSLGSGLGGHDSRGHNHSNKSESDQKVMHGAFSLCGSEEPVSETMIGWIGKIRNSTSIYPVMQLGV